MQLSDFLDAGITTAVGVLGTDTVTRSQAGFNAFFLALLLSNTACVQSAELLIALVQLHMLQRGNPHRHSWNITPT